MPDGCKAKTSPTLASVAFRCVPSLFMNEILPFDVDGLRKSPFERRNIERCPTPVFRIPTRGRARGGATETGVHRHPGPD